MRHIAIVLLLVVVILPHYVLADDSNQLVARSLPSKIIANTDGVIQVYPQTYGNTIDKVVATSSDSSIIQIVDVEKDPGYGAVNVKISALNAGQATIAIAASGFSSLQLPVTVYPDSQGATNLLIKTTPSIFSTSGPNAGYVAVESTNPDGVPAPVSADTPIKLSVSDSSIIGLTEDHMIIKQGSYYTMEKFVVNKRGTSTITASSSSTQPVSSTVTIQNPNSQYTLQAYSFPKVINNHKDAVGYVVVQLLDSNNNPTIAQNDIPISLRVVNASNIPAVFASAGSINTSLQSPIVQVNDNLIIKKGSYWGFVPVQFTSAIFGQALNFNGTASIPFNVYISAKGYSISTSQGSVNVGNQPAGTDPSSHSPCQVSPNTSVTTPAAATFITCPQNVVIDDKTPFLSTIPILATGQNELIGALRLANPDNGAPVFAKSDLNFRIDSSDTSTLSVSGVEMNAGSQAALVFAQVGNAANPVTLNVVSNVPQALTPTIIAPPATTTGLVADPLIPQVLSNTKFPLAIYTTKNGALDSFKNDFNALISPQEAISPVQLTVPSGEPIFLTDETLLKDGKQNISITSPDYSSSFTIQGATPKPSNTLLDFPTQVFSNSKTLFSIDLLDGNQFPILASHDMNIQLVSSNPSVLAVPDTVQIKKGSYYMTFDANSKTAGTAQISVLSDEIPLSTFNLAVTSLIPQVSIDSVDRVNNNYPLTATVTATYNQSPLAGMNVDWKVTGATIKSMDSLTNKDGQATISMISNDPNTVSIEADVGGAAYQTTIATKVVSINAPLASAAPVSTDNAQANPPSSSFTIMGISPLLFVIPGAGAAAFIVLKKKNMLEGISEKISIGERISGIRERMSELRQK